MGLHQAIRNLLLEPLFEPVHDRTTDGLVINPARLRGQLLLPRLVLMVEYLLECPDHHLTLHRKDVFESRELTPAVSQAVTANELVFMRLIAAQGVGPP